MAYKLDILLGTQVDVAEIKKVEKQLDALYAKYSKQKKIKIGLDEDTSSKAIGNMNKKIDSFNKTTQSASKATEGFADRMKTAVVSTVQWSIAVGGLYSAINKIKDAVGFTVAFDTELTNIAIVTGKTREEVQGLKEEYLALGEALQISSVELAKTAVELYRQGLGAQEVNDRLTSITQAAKVAGLEVADVTTYVTSGINAMGVSAERFNDVLLKVAGVSATDYDKIAKGLQKSAAEFRAAGFDLEQGAAAISVIQEVTQEAPESIGTSVKSILARFSKLNDDGEDNSKALNEIDTALKTVGISLRGTDGQLREVDEVLGELGPKWDGLTKNQQAYLKTQIAG